MLRVFGLFLLELEWCSYITPTIEGWGPELFIAFHLSACGPVHACTGWVPYGVPLPHTRLTFNNLKGADPYTPYKLKGPTSLFCLKFYGAAPIPYHFMARALALAIK